ncbi:AraC family transcriptional regulator [Azospirillum sp. RWY-5-1]|uniref:AraC family transcriptional regulator n=2 Tax=Azospirillum oleiclasticum TaxID=2735135 RepID=A0ABX2T7Q7_9PROT|nr:AraC family transcriptional regulator [Azospirillum oleiclasticum]NYZ20354.1 AraC family transcriptional regulator [Azospirillum oleiclasticum]
MHHVRSAMVLSRSYNVAADPLSDVVTVLGGRSVRLTRLEASGDWALGFPAQARLKFVALLRGGCCILLPDHPPRRMAEGDVFLIGHTAYTVASEPGIEPIDGTPLYREPGHDVARLNGDDTVLLGGGIAFTGIGGGFMLDALPVFLRIGRASPSATAVSRTLELLDAETVDGRPGSSVVTMRLADVLLVEAIRAYVADQGESCVGWIGALGDRQIGEALRLMHGEIDRPWTVASLAARVGMSRSAFSSRFSSRVGRPPLDYLTHWRMLVARRLLSEERADVASIASAVGYTSQSAFGHAYKRTFGHSPRRP